MAALSDYLESQLLNHLFRSGTLDKPTKIAIALTSGVPLDSDTGATLPELPASIIVGADTRNTNYQRISLEAPSDDSWLAVGTDPDTAYSVYRDDPTPANSGYFFPLYLVEGKAQNESSNGNATTLTFPEFPSVNFYAPASKLTSANATDPGYPIYDGNGFIKNAEQKTFNAALTDRGWVSGIAILDDSDVGAGNLLMYAKLENPRYVYTGDNIKFDKHSLEISLK